MSIFRETFISPFEKDTRSEAYQVLEAIRAAHPTNYGWVEIHGFVEQLPNGKWRTVRVHEKHSI